MDRIAFTLIVVVLYSQLGLGWGGKMRYDNFRVYQLQPQTAEEMATLRRWDGQRDSYIFLDGLAKIGGHVKLLVAPQAVAEFTRSVIDFERGFELLDENAQRELDIEEDVADSNRREDVYKWRQYHELNDTYNWMKSLARRHPQLATVFVAGRSYEGRDILGVKVSFDPLSDSEGGTNKKKSIFLEGGMHAREWISPATTTYIIQELINDSNERLRAVARRFDWYIVPHANPDGYVYTHTTDRLWRKTRTPYGNNCYGADPNRNWDFHWNEIGASSNPCSETYAGPKAFSEIETRSLAEFISSLKDQLFLYVSFHSYSQLLLFPYGHTAELPPNYDDLRRVFNAAVKGMRRRYGTRYSGGNTYDAIYPAAGASEDWAYGVAGAPFAFTYELRPSALYFWTGFRLPAQQIIPTAEETVDSLIEMVVEASKNLT